MVLGSEIASDYDVDDAFRDDDHLFRCFAFRPLLYDLVGEHLLLDRGLFQVGSIAELGAHLPVDGDGVLNAVFDQVCRVIGRVRSQRY